ncbi:MAG TPA: CpXC domain-containing protein [Roseiflexaceae bacterium]|nr:CpXC domain-containing protein [Roseiflexaceae bacterium]
MSAPAPQVIQLACPNCRTPMRAQVFTVIDVGVQPELKNYLLAGQLNVAVCPNCGTPAMIAAPLIYHDPAKQLFLVHFPQQLNARPEEQERFIGDATSLIMRDLPADAPKGYLLAPRRFLTLNSLLDAVLEADGISREVIEAQRARVELISRMAEAFEQGEQQLADAVAQNKAALDYEFFATLTAFADASAQGGRDDSAQLLENLRAKLIELTGFDASSLDRAGDEYEDLDLDEAIQRLADAADAELEQTIAELRPVLDYSFFEAWTARIDAAAQAGDSATAERLTARRALILETVERMDKQAQQLFEAGAKVLEEILAAPDIAAALRERSDKIDEAFLLVLQANAAAAQRMGNTQAVERLAEIERLALQIAQESLSPEERFINDLLSAEKPQDATKLLRQNPRMITADFVKRLNELADQMEGNGRKPLGERLRQLGREAGAMLF